MCLLMWNIVDNYVVIYIYPHDIFYQVIVLDNCDEYYSVKVTQVYLL